MVKTVRSEWWHHQPCRISNGKLDWFPYSAGKETAHAKTTNNELKQVAEADRLIVQSRLFAKVTEASLSEFFSSSR